MTALRILETVHGHLGILAAVALAHPAILLWRGRALTRGLWWSVVLTTGLTVLAFGTGLLIYEDYRTEVKRGLFLESPVVGYLFETKEHVAWAVLVLALGAGFAALVAPRRARRVRRAAAIAYVVAAVVCLVTVGLGTYVAAVAGFPQ